MAKAYVCLAIDLVKRGRAGWLAVLERRLPIDYRANAVLLRFISVDISEKAGY